jgi:hypothetical protein
MEFTARGYFMRFFTPFRPLLKGWLLSFAGWGMVSFILGSSFVGNTDASWSDAVRSAIRDQLPWAILTPILFRGVRLIIETEKNSTDSSESRPYLERKHLCRVTARPDGKL